MKFFSLLSCVIGFVGLTTQSSFAQEMTLRVLSYNVKSLPKPIGKDYWRMTAIGEQLAQRRQQGNAPHVVFIQEGFSKYTARLIQAAGYPYIQRGPRNGLKSNGGLWVLSEYPLNQRRFTVYRKCASWDCMSRKGVTFSQMQIPGVPRGVDLFNTHMNADPTREDPFTRDSVTQRVRRSQIRQAAWFVAGNRSSSNVAIFGGDFNLVQNDREYQLLRDVFASWRDPQVECVSGERPCTGDLEENPGQSVNELADSLDHHFVSNALDEKMTVTPVYYRKIFRDRVDGVELSDHWGHEIHYRLHWE